MHRHFEVELEELNRQLLWMGGLVERALQNAIQALVGPDRKLAREVIEEENAINALQVEIDDRALRLLALQQPMATDLRLIVAAMKINSDLERIGDQAVNIAQGIGYILDYPQVKPYADIPRMGAIAQEMVHAALDAFVHRNVEQARAVLLRDDEVDTLRDQIYRQMLTHMAQHSEIIIPAFQLTLVARNLERVADHATNIAEDVIYMVVGRDVRHHALDKR